MLKNWSKSHQEWIWIVIYRTSMEKKKNGQKFSCTFIPCCRVFQSTLNKPLMLAHSAWSHFIYHFHKVFISFQHYICHQNTIVGAPWALAKRLHSRTANKIQNVLQVAQNGQKGVERGLPMLIKQKVENTYPKYLLAIHLLSMNYIWPNSDL